MQHHKCFRAQAQFWHRAAMRSTRADHHQRFGINLWTPTSQFLLVSQSVLANSLCKFLAVVKSCASTDFTICKTFCDVTVFIAPLPNFEYKSSSLLAMSSLFLAFPSCELMSSTH